MPRKSKGARLYLKPGKTKYWYIRDGSTTVSTGCGESDRASAEKEFARYLYEKHRPSRSCRSISEILISEVLDVYTRDVIASKPNTRVALLNIDRLLDFFGGLKLSEINGALCRDYVAFRGGKTGGARRELQDLAAAINHHAKEGLHREIVRVVLPPAGEARTRWLTRSEVARLLWACLATRETQGAVKTIKRPLRHLARFILVGVYTGSRPGAILGLSWHQAIGRGYVDLESGMVYRLREGAVATNKRQPPVPLAPELWRHMRRWSRMDGGFGPVVRFNGESVLSVKTALARAAQIAGLDVGVTAYVLRHTTGSWLVQKGVSTRKVAEVLGTGEAMIERHYGHMAPEHLRDEVAQIGRK